MCLIRGNMEVDCMLYSPLRVCMYVCVCVCGVVVSHSRQHGGRLHVVQPIACMYVCLYVYVCVVVM